MGSWSGGAGIKNHLSKQEMQETQTQPLGWEDALEWEMATRSSVLAWDPVDREAWWASARRAAENVPWLRTRGGGDAGAERSRRASRWHHRPWWWSPRPLRRSRDGPAGLVSAPPLCAQTAVGCLRTCRHLLLNKYFWSDKNHPEHLTHFKEKVVSQELLIFSWTHNVYYLL